MGKYRDYQVYENTHNEFVSELPQGWVLSKFKYEVDYVEEPGILANDFHEAGVPLLRIQNVKGRFTSGDIKTYLDPQKVKGKWEHFKTATGDLLISGSASTDLIAEVTEQYEGAVPYTGLIRLRVKKDRTDKNYVRYFVQSELFKNQIDNLKTGSTIQHFGPIHLQQIVYPSTFMEEQAQISNFLDYETAKIDNLTDKQQQLIELLKEKRQAVISHAVTKGLNPNVPMKDSDVEWLGEVPEHWERIKLKHITHQIVDAEHKTAPYFDDGEYLVCRTTNVRDGKLQLEGGKYTNIATYEEWTKRSQPEIGDILFTREAPAGEACVYKGEIPLCLGQRMVLFKLDQTRVLPEFVLHSIYSGLADDFVKQLSQGSTVVHFNMADIQNIPLFEPSMKEQAKIVEYLSKTLAKYDSLTSSAFRTIELMQERRTALISAAVTGKIDVRDWYPPKQQGVQG